MLTYIYKPPFKIKGINAHPKPVVKILSIV